MKKLALKRYGEYTLFVRFNERGVHEYVVAYGYDKQSDSWEHGTYEQDLECAIQIFNKKTIMATC